MNRHSLITATVALTLLSLPLAALAGSVLVNSPDWKFIGPEPIEGVQSNFGGVVLGPDFDVTGRVTSIAIDPNGGSRCGPHGDSACRIIVGTAGGGVWMTGDGGNTFEKITGILDADATYNGSFPQTTVGALALDSTTNPPTIYLATGEGNHFDSFWGDGIFSSADLGGSWSQIAGSVNLVNRAGLPASSLFDGFTRIAVDATHSPPYVYAAVTNPAGVNRAGLVSYGYSYPESWGIWRSTDGGSTFAQESVSQMGGCADVNNDPCTGDDVVIDPTTNYIYAAVHDGVSTDYVFPSNGDYAIVRSTDSGNTWTPLSLPGISQGHVGRISLAAYGGTVYVMVGSRDRMTYLGFFASPNSGASWTQETVPCFNPPGSSVVIDGTASGLESTSSCGLVSIFSQSFFDQAIAIDASFEPNVVAFGGVGVYVSGDDGSANSWQFLGASGGIHSDVHALAFDPFDPFIMYAGTDGGLFRIDLTASPLNITALTGSGPNTIVAAELYSIGPHPIGTSSPAVDAQTFLAGMQDNGTARSAPSPTAQPTPSVQWSEVDTGPLPVTPADSSFALLDANDSSRAYHEFDTYFDPTTNLRLPQPAYSGSGGAAGSWIKSPPTLGSGDLGAQFFAPLAGDPSVADFLLLGSFYTYASAAGMQSWTQQTTKDLTRGCAAGSNPCAVTDLSFAPSNDSNGYAVTGITGVWTGSAPGGFYVWHTGGANKTSGNTWSEITGNLRNNNDEQSYTLEPSSLTVDPNDAGKVYLGLQCSPFLFANCVSSLYRAAPNGSSTTWVAVDGSKKGVAPINGPVYKVLVDNTDTTGNSLLAGTAAGLFMSSDGGADWTPYNNGIVPEVPVLDIEQNSKGDVFVATHGAGAYELANPLPFFVGYKYNESECGGGPGSTCTLTLTAPSNLRDGDVIIAAIDMGGHFGTPPTPPDSTWVSLPIANAGGALSMETGDCADGDIGTEYVFAHIYGASTETGTYSFEHGILSYCNGTLSAELEGALFGYRGANQTLSNYILYGYSATTISGTVTVGPAPANSPSGGVLLNIFWGANYENPESGETSTTFTAPTGTPPATAETPLAPGGVYFLADVGIPDSGTALGQYSTTSSFTAAHLFGWQIFVPE